MSDTPQKTVVLCQDMLCVLGEDLTLANGQVLPKGTRALVLPQTIAACILTPEGTSLAEAWPSLSRAGHAHQSVVDLGTELARLTNRVSGVELAQIEGSTSLGRLSTNFTDARTLLQELRAQVDSQGASTVRVVGAPQFQLPDQIENTGEISFEVSAESYLAGGNIGCFLLTVPELAIYDMEFAARDNAASIAFTPYGWMADQVLNVRVVAVDNLGNRSDVSRQTPRLIIYGIQPPVITSPENGEAVESLAPSIQAGPMEVVGELSDTPKTLRVQIATDAAFAGILFDSGVTVAAPEYNVVTPPENLEPATTYFVRARWTGNFLGDSPWSMTTRFITPAATNNGEI